MENLETELKHRIDENGYFIGDEFTNEVNDNLIKIQPQEGFHKPKWNGEKWIEGDTQTAQTQKIENARNSFNQAIQTHLDTKAQELRYDNIISARSYAWYDNEFQGEALKLSQWASNCWVVAGQIETDVLNGTRTMPTIDEVLNEMPTYE